MGIRDITRHFLAEMSLLGLMLNAMGGLYLAYDLLGGKRGPLRILTRAVTYSFLFGFGYRVVFGPLFGIIVGIGLGTSVALESAVIVSELTNPWIRSLFFAFHRGLTAGIAGGFAYGYSFGLLFGIFTFIGLFLVYSTSLSPLRLYSAVGKPKVTRESFTASLSLSGAVVVGVAAFASGIFLNDRTLAIKFAGELALVVAVMRLLVTTISPFIEWWADNLSERRLGAFGIFLIILGFLFQTIQYLAVILRIPVF